jgi:threonine aldolase
VAVPTDDGRLTPEGLEFFVPADRDPHSVQPRVLSLAQPTELGTVYLPNEIRAMADWAHERGMFVHLDGARLANAAAALGVGLADITTHVGVDALSFGGTKNGMMFGEAVIFLRPGLADSFPYIRQQCMQSASKTRFIAAQFEALLGSDLWRRNAAHANKMARRLHDKVIKLRGLSIKHPVEANAVFAVLPRNAISVLQEREPFHVWNRRTGEVRWMCAFDTTPEDVDIFAGSVACALEEAGSTDVQSATPPSA